MKKRFMEQVNTGEKVAALLELFERKNLLPEGFSRAPRTEEEVQKWTEYLTKHPAYIINTIYDNNLDEEATAVLIPLRSEDDLMSGKEDAEESYKILLTTYKAMKNELEKYLRHQEAFDSLARVVAEKMSTTIALQTIPSFEFYGIDTTELVRLFEDMTILIEKNVSSSNKGMMN